MTMTMILFLFLIRSRILPKHLSTLVLVILLFVIIIITTENIRVRGCLTFRYLLLRRWVVALS